MRLSFKLSDFLEIKSKFFNRLQNRGYPKWFLSDTFYFATTFLSKKIRSVLCVFRKIVRNPLFNRVHLKNLFLYHLGNDFDN